MTQITIALKLFISVLTVPVTGTIDLSPIDNIDGEWVDPGYEVVTELDFDPYDYVEDVQAGQAFFMDTDAGEMLRLILVGDNRVLVFDEPWESYREYTIEPPWEIFSATYSRNGRYMIVSVYKDSVYYDGYYERELKAYTGFRIEITEDGFLADQFDPKPGGYGYYYYLSDDGRITGSNERGVIGLYPQGDVEEFLTREPAPIMWQRQGCSYDGSLIVLGNVPIENGVNAIQGYDWSGNLLWETSIGDRNLTGLRVSPSGEYILAPARNGGLVCYSGEDGSRLWETANGLMCDYPQIPPDGKLWIMSPDQIGHCYFYSGNLENIYNPGLISDVEMISNTMENPICLNINNRGFSLFWIQFKENTRLFRMMFMNLDRSILWASRKFDTLTQNRRFSFQFANNTADYFRCVITAISEDGSRICYTDYNSIKVLRFEEVE